MIWTLVCLIVIPVGVVRRVVHPVGERREPPIVRGLAGRAHRPDALGPDPGMYRYHNTLSSPHAASSPWWAWVFDFKPVWFYQEGFAGGTAGADLRRRQPRGLVARHPGAWPSPPGRRSSGGARRSPSSRSASPSSGWPGHASTAPRSSTTTTRSLPFLFLALAYFLAELWHGASRRTWLLVRLAGAAAVLAPMVFWMLHRPLCGFVGVDSVEPRLAGLSDAHSRLPLAAERLAIAIVVGIGLLMLVRELLSFADEDDRATGRACGRWGWRAVAQRGLGSAGRPTSLGPSSSRSSSSTDHRTST